MITKFLLYPVIQFPLTAFLYFYVIQRFSYIVKKLKYKSKIQESMFMICVNHLIHNVGGFAFYYYINKLGYLHLHLYVHLSLVKYIGYMIVF
jgi:hypothetical protein